jgi:flagellar basal-body rod protein FlgG
LNNLANLHTVGFKRSQAVLTALPYEDGRELYPVENAPQRPKPPIDLGYGVELSATRLDPSQGPLKTTGQSFDVAIEGPGFFRIRDGKAVRFTRSGLWTTNEEGHLCLSLGLVPKPLEPLITLPADVDSIKISEAGIITATTLGNAEPTPLGQIQLARFRNPAALKLLEGSLFSLTSASGPSQIGTPNSPGFGVLRQGMLELSNVPRDEELEHFQEIQSLLLLLKQLARQAETGQSPGPFARKPLSRTQRASAHSDAIPPPGLEPLKELGKEGRNLIEEYLQSERMKTIKRTLGLK